MAEPLVAAPLAGASVGLAGGRFVIAEWRDAGGVRERPLYIAPLHTHLEEEEAWYVLEGRLRFLVAGRELEASAGELVIGPPGEPHTYWNPGPEPCRYLVVMGPRTARMLEEMHATADRSPERLRALFESHGMELHGWPER
jgi:mannose-6-phosphate isomerase-like protein (cupin superfamily)